MDQIRGSHEQQDPSLNDGLPIGHPFLAADDPPLPKDPPPKGGFPGSPTKPESETLPKDTIKPAGFKGSPAPEDQGPGSLPDPQEN